MNEFFLASIIGLSFIIGFFLPVQIRIYVLAALAIPQLYFGVNSLSFFDIWLMVTVLLSVNGTRARGREARLLTALWLLIASFATALIWSEPDSYASGILWIARLAMFALLVQILMYLYRASPKTVYRAIYWALPGLVIQAALVIYFRFNPVQEISFLRTTTADIFVGVGAKGLFNGAANNVFDPAKSGGVLINANVASMAAGVGVFLILILLNHSEKKWLLAPLILEVASVFATGSKTGVTLLVVLTLVAWVLNVFGRKSRAAWIVPLVLMVGVASFAIPTLLTRFFPSFTQDSTISLDSRSEIWNAANELFQKNSVLGMGFGGWAREIVHYPSAYGLPPHNLLILTWANGGLFSALLLLLFLSLTIIYFLRSILISRTSKERNQLVFSLSAILWVFLHGMGDNTVLYGGNHELLLTALAFAFISGHLSGKNDPENLSDSTYLKRPLREFV